MVSRSVAERARRHAALGDPIRLAIVDELWRSDRSTAELGAHVGLASNLLAYHLDILERAGLIRRGPSAGDRRRRYVCALPEALAELGPQAPIEAQEALFICTRNSARSPLAAALWHQATASPALSAGTDPAGRVHRGAVAAGRRAGLDLTGAQPRALDELPALPALVVTVCDRAHEQLEPGPDWLHWSIPDPAATGTARAFDAAVSQLRERIANVTATT